MKMTLPTDSEERKGVPLYSGVLKYAPAALAGVAKVSKAGNDKHNPGEPMHHARGKSSDHADCIVRHTMDVADLIAALERTDPCEYHPDYIFALLSEVSQLSWRTLMWSQELHEKYAGAPLAPGAKAAPAAVEVKGFVEHVFPKMNPPTFEGAIPGPPHKGLKNRSMDSRCNDPSCWCQSAI